jgi:tyrosyl-tRNA synthetase
VGQHHRRHDLIRKKLGVPAWGLTFPLITKADGTKFGKTEDGAVWLDPQEDQPLQVLPVLRQHRGQHGGAYLKKFTLLSPDEIEALEAEARRQPRPPARPTRRWPARSRPSSTERSACDDAVKASEIMFGGGLDGITEALFGDVAGEIPTKAWKRPSSRAPAPARRPPGPQRPLPLQGPGPKKDIEGGGIYLNNVRGREAAALGRDRRPPLRQSTSSCGRASAATRSCRAE